MKDHVENGGVYVDNFAIDFKEMELEVLDWMCLAQDRYRWRALVDTAMNIRELFGMA